MSDTDVRDATSSVVVQKEASHESWNGANGTSYWADPREQLVVVTMTAGPGEIRKYYREQMAALVYGAMER